MTNIPDYDVVIIGAGIAGLATAAALSNHKDNSNRIKLKIYEKASKLQPVGAAIGLFPNGLRALQSISPNVASKVKESCIPSLNMQMKDLEGNLVRDTNVQDVARVGPTYLVWYLLQQYLADDLQNQQQQQQQGGEEHDEDVRRDEDVEKKLSLGHVFESYSVDETTGFVKVQVSKRSKREERHDDDTNDNDSQEEKEEVTCRVLIGADGIKSQVRTQMVGTEREHMYHGKMMFRAVLDLNALDDGICPPAGTSLAWQGDEKGKLFAVRETARGIATFTSMAVFDKPDLISQSSSTTAADNHGARRIQRLKHLFQEYPPEVHHILDRTPPSAVYENAVYDMDVEECWSTSMKKKGDENGPVVILGDAAHAMTPGMGQGANQGLEDSCELAYYLAPVLLDIQKEEEDAQAVVGSVVDYARERIEHSLDEFWHSRIERVKRVHAASRAMTKQVNQSSKENPVSFKQKRDSSIFDSLYEWTPSDCK